MGKFFNKEFGEEFKKSTAQSAGIAVGYVGLLALGYGIYKGVCWASEKRSERKLRKEISKCLKEEELYKEEGAE